MNKIIDVNKAVEISSKLRKRGNKIVVVGGIFDILHVGHVKFLENAKKRGDLLFLILESDEAAKKFKGKNRPINSQKDRAHVLSALNTVDYIINLPRILKDKEYDKLMVDLKPAILATTLADPNKNHKIRQAGKIGAKVIEVIDRIPNKSSSIIIESLDL